VVSHLQQLVPEYTGDPIGLQAVDPAAISADVARQVRAAIDSAEALALPETQYA
jgi:hypothetical protein